jgi:hypothetical protein
MVLNNPMYYSFTKHKIIKTALIMMAVVVSLLAYTTTVSAQGQGGGNDNKVEICHRTSSQTNPYSHQTPPTRQEVSKNSIKGENGHSSHTGPLFPAPNWGDIIPPFEAGEGNGEKWDAYEGMNWTAEGQAIWNNNCAVPQTTGGNGGGEVLGDSATTSQGAASQVAAPAGGVSAGGEGTIAGSIVGLGASFTALGYGVVNLLKKEK